MAKCDITPISAFQSTNLSSKIETFNGLSDRILNTLGYPFINIEIHRDSLYNNIQIAVEMFTKFAGYTQEYLLFDSDLYEVNKGIRLDQLFSIHTNPLLNEEYGESVESKDFSSTIDDSKTNYVSTSAILSGNFVSSSLSALSSVLNEGLSAHDIVDDTLYDAIVEANSDLSQFFIKQPVKTFTIRGELSATNTSFINSFDYDVMDYRKVMAVQDFEEGSTTGINTLFTIEQTLAQQASCLCPAK